MSVSTLVQISLVFAGFGLTLGMVGWGMGLLLNGSKRTDSDLPGNILSVRPALICILGGGFSLGTALILLFSAGIWGGISFLLSEVTPSSLALVSIAVGPAPLLISALSSGIATLLGGSVDASAARNCTVFGIDFGATTSFTFYGVLARVDNWWTYRIWPDWQWSLGACKSILKKECSLCLSLNGTDCFTRVYINVR